MEQTTLTEQSYFRVTAEKFDRVAAMNGEYVAVVPIRVSYLEVLKPGQQIRGRIAKLRRLNKQRRIGKKGSTWTKEKIAAWKAREKRLKIIRSSRENTSESSKGNH